MAPQPQFWDSAKAAQITTATGLAITAGSSSATTTYWLFNDKGSILSADLLSGAYLRAEAFDGSTWVTSGLPVLDESWTKVALTGIDNTGDASMEAQSTAEIPLGAGRQLALKNIPQGCGRSLTVRIAAPAGASTSAPQVRMVVIYNESSLVLANGVTLPTGGGIKPDYLDRANRRLTRGRLYTGSGIASVSGSRGGYAIDGVPYWFPSLSTTLDQNAADGALAAGQSYIANLSQGAGSVTITKSNKAVTPTAPATPTGNIFLAKVTVRYEAGGTSIINAGDVDTSAVVYGEFHLYAGAGLVLKIGAGEAVSPNDKLQFRTTTATLALTDNSTNYVWVLPNGTFQRTATSAPPEDSAVFLGEVAASGGVITTVHQSSRATVNRAIDEYDMILPYYGTVTVITDAATAVLPFDAFLESYKVLHGKPSSGGAGSHVYNITFRGPTVSMSTAGTSIFSTGVSVGDDQRPTVAHGALTSSGATGTGVHPEGAHDWRSFVRYTKFSFDCISAGGTTMPEDVYVVLHFRKR